MVMQIQRKKQHVPTKKTKHKISWHTDSNLPNIQGYSLPETIGQGLKLYQSLISLNGTPIGAINPYTMELLIDPSCNLDPVLNGKLVQYFSDKFTGYSKVVEKTNFKYGQITTIDQEVGRRLREYISISHICQQAEHILLDNYYIYWYLHKCKKSRADRMRNTYYAKMGEDHKNSILDNFKLNYGSQEHRELFRDIWDCYISYNVIQKPMCEMV